jgi:hypothetical protein
MQKYIKAGRWGARTTAMAAVLVLLVASGCHRSGEPDVSGIAVKVRIERFDRDLFGVDSNRIAAGLQALRQKYPVFLPVYLSRIMNYGQYADSSYVLDQEFRTFLVAREIRDLEDTVNAHFPDLSGLQRQLDDAIRYTKHYFPEYTVPHCLAFISALSNYGVVTVDSVLAIGLDMFLGPAYPYYAKVSDPYPQYMIRQFAPQYITSDCMKAVEQELFPPLADGKPLVQQMIDHGRQLYFLDRMMPDTPDSIKIGYTSRQMQWCIANEQMIWQYFIQNSLLYSTDMEKDLHYVGEGPGTEGFPGEAPGNIGSWVGWQIVRAYMSRKPAVTLQQLMKMEDLQKILDDSRYRPG